MLISGVTSYIFNYPKRQHCPSFGTILPGPFCNFSVFHKKQRTGRLVEASCSFSSDIMCFPPIPPACLDLTSIFPPAWTRSTAGLSTFLNCNTKKTPRHLLESLSKRKSTIITSYFLWLSLLLHPVQMTDLTIKPDPFVCLPPEICVSFRNPPLAVAAFYFL